MQEEKTIKRDKIKLFVSLAEIVALEGGLVSRSQAKNIASRFEQFSEIELNFEGVESIGQSFADQLFRVWPIHHSETTITAMNTNDNVKKMISHVRKRTDLPQPED